MSSAQEENDDEDEEVYEDVEERWWANDWSMSLLVTVVVLIYNVPSWCFGDFATIKERLQSYCKSRVKIS